MCLLNSLVEGGGCSKQNDFAVRVSPECEVCDKIVAEAKKHARACFSTPAGKLDDNGVKAGIEEKQLQACFRASRLEFSPIPYVTLYVYIYIIFTRETTVSAQERHSIDIGTCTLDCSISSICQIRYGIHNDEFLGSPARSNFVDQEGLAPQ